MQYTRESLAQMEECYSLRSILIRVSLVLFLFAQTLLVSQPVSDGPENQSPASADSLPGHLTIMARK